MPSPIIHLEILHQLSQQLDISVSPDLVLGCISPDAIHMRPNQTWADKTVTHFYDEADNSFNQAIKEAKLLIKCESKAFKLGYLIHLYTDYLWREYIYTPYFLTHKDFLMRSELHALYYRDMKKIDAVILSHSKWQQNYLYDLLHVNSMSCLPLLSEEEIAEWCQKVIKMDLISNEINEEDLEAFTLNQIYDFMEDCSSKIKSQMKLFED